MIADGLSKIRAVWGILSCEADGLDAGEEDFGCIGVSDGFAVESSEEGNESEENTLRAVLVSEEAGEEANERFGVVFTDVASSPMCSGVHERGREEVGSERRDVWNVLRVGGR